MCLKSFVVGTLCIFFICLNCALHLKAVFDTGFHCSLSHSMVSSAATKWYKLLLCSWHIVFLLLLLLLHSYMYCMLVISLIYSCLVLASLKTRHGRNIISFHFFFVYNWTWLSVYRASSVFGATHITIAVLFCSSSLLCISNYDRAAAEKLDSQWVRTVMKSPLARIVTDTV